MKSIGLTTALSVLLFAAPAFAAPPQLLDHTITISFTATGQAKSAERQFNYNTQVSRIIYVSSAGRLFMRHRATNPRGQSRGGDFGPGEGGGSFSFQGNRLVGVLPYGTGARQITVAFDPGFSSCTASVIEGGSGGIIRRKGPDGIMYEITGASTSTVSCSIRSGNAFAG